MRLDRSHGAYSKRCIPPETRDPRLCQLTIAPVVLGTLGESYEKGHGGDSSAQQGKLEGQAAWQKARCIAPVEPCHSEGHHVEMMPLRVPVSFPVALSPEQGEDKGSHGCRNEDDSGVSNSSGERVVTEPTMEQWTLMDKIPWTSTGTR